MKILIVTRFIHKNYGPWVDGLIAKGHEVIFLNLGNDKLNHQSVEVINETPKPLPHILRANSGLRTILWKRLPRKRIKEVLKSTLTDVIICREFVLISLQASLVSRFVLPKAQIIFYDQQKACSMHWMRRAARILVSKTVFTPCCDNYELEKGRRNPARVIPFSSDPRIGETEIQRRYSDILDRKLKLISVGKLFFEDYNFLLLLDVLKDGLLHEFELTIIGSTRKTMPRFEAEIEQRAADIRSAGGQVKVLKDLPHEKVLFHMRQSDVFVMPTVRHTAAFTQFEAMSLGLPVIIASHPSNGTTYAVKDGYNGFVVDPNKRSIANALRTVLQNRSSLMDFGLRSLRRLESEFSNEVVASRFEALFQAKEHAVST